jgi:hypothetical protein
VLEKGAGTPYRRIPPEKIPEYSQESKTHTFNSFLITNYKAMLYEDFNT